MVKLRGLHANTVHVNSVSVSPESAFLSPSLKLKAVFTERELEAISEAFNNSVWKKTHFP